MKAVGPQNNIFYQGVVEDRNDPLKLGRVKVRVFGVHSDDAASVSTADLPWAPVIMPANNPSNSGVGTSPNGLVEGSFVIVIFIDGVSCQNPVVLGSTVGINPNNKNVKETSAKEISENSNTVTSIPKVDVPDETIGKVSEKYEVGNRGPGYVSPGTGDLGGRSYGLYQLSSNAGSVKSFLLVSNFRSVFAGMQINSKEFVAAWENLGNTRKAEFAKDQHDFIEKSYFVPCVNKLQFLNITERSKAISEMIWSYAVQYGPAGGASKIKRALNGKNVADLPDEDIIELCYTDRKNNVPNDFKSSPTLHKGLRQRFDDEKKDCLAIIGRSPSKGLSPATPLPKDSYGQPDESKSTIISKPSKGAPNGQSTFCDPNGVYPKNGYLGKSNTNKLAKVEEINKTIQKVKRLTTVVSNGFKEPYIFNPAYPFNKVYESESGHIIEIDDTKDGERIHVYHRSGSFIEFHPDGTIVKKSVKDENEVVISNKSLYVFGDNNIFVEGNVKVQSMGNITMESESNITMRAQGNISIEAAGKTELLSVGNIGITSGSKIEKTAPLINQNVQTASANVTVDVGEKLELKKILQDEDEPPKPDDWGTESNGQEQTFATKKELDETVGFKTESGEPTVSAKDIQVNKVETKEPDTSAIDSTEVFKPSFKLSDNYILADLTTATAAFKYKLQAQCGLSEKEIVKNLANVAEGILEPITKHFGKNSFIISNAFRHSKGSGKSQHLLGMAVDLQFPGSADNIPHIAQEIKGILPEWDQLIIEYHSKNPVIHISFNKGKNRKTVFSTYSTKFSGLRPYGIYDRNQQLIYTV